MKIRTIGEYPYTRVVGTQVGRLHVGQAGVLAKPLPSLCCKHIEPAGALISITARWSKKRVEIVTARGTGHKVKASKVWWV